MMKNEAMERLNAHPRGAMRPNWRREERRHKLGVGEIVTLVGRAGEIRSKEMDKELEAGRFQITRLLPIEGESFQYRIKDATTGRERVVAEEQITVFSP